MNAQLIYKICPKDLFKLFGFVDSDYAGDLGKRRSLTGSCFLIGGNLLSWNTSLQLVVALSSTEDEYIALSEAIKEAIWLKRSLKDFGLSQKSVKIYYDNQSTIHLSKNQQYHSRTKNIYIKFHFIREQIEKQKVEMLKVQSSENTTDILTKIFTRKKFLKCLQTIGFLEPMKE